MSYIALGFLISGIVLFVSFILFSIFNYRKRFNNEYHLRNYYPYELNYEGKFVDNLFGNICFCIFIGLFIAFYIFFDQKHINGFYTFVLIAGIVNYLCIIGVSFVPLKSIKSHLFFSVCLFSFTFLLAASLGINQIIRFTEYKKISELILGIFSLLFALFVFVLMLNPKLSRWAQVDTFDNEDGSKSYIRPKFFPLAYTEWILIILNNLLPILVIISTLLSN